MTPHRPSQRDMVAASLTAQRGVDAFYPKSARNSPLRSRPMADAPQITDVPLTDQQRLATARCINFTREAMDAAGYDQNLLDELTILRATFLGPDLKLPIETTELAA